jgi:hypothetical protein
MASWCLFGDEPHHPLVGLGELPLVDVPAQHHVVVHPFVEHVAVIRDGVGERVVERVENAGELIV